MPDKKKEVDRVVKWVIIPLFIVTLILIVLIREWATGGIVAFVLLGFSFVIYTNPKYQKNLIGIPDNILKGSLWGFGIFGFFFVMMKLVPALSIAVPTVPQALTEFSFQSLSLGVPITLGVLVIIFPFAETAWKGAMLSLLITQYGLSLFKAILITAFLFGSVLHLLAYGVVISSAESLNVAFQQINSISGILFTAVLFGAIASYILWKTKSFLPVALSHSGINFVIVSTTLAIISFG